MQILIYHCPEAPEAIRYSGQFLAPGFGPKGKAGLFGVRFDGAEPDVIRQKMEAFLVEQAEKAAKLAAPRKAPAKKDAPAPAIDEDEELV